MCTQCVAAGQSDALLCAVQLRLSLSELDRRWNDILDGRQYHGEAINPKNLSIWERMTGVGKVLHLPCTHQRSAVRFLWSQCVH